MDTEGIFEQAARWYCEGYSVALASVTSTWGSAPRPTGSYMAMNEKQDMVGSVSGGCIESAVMHEALQVMKDKKPRLLSFGVTDETAWSVGLTCGGTITIYVEPLE